MERGGRGGGVCLSLCVGRGKIKSDCIEKYGVRQGTAAVVDLFSRTVRTDVMERLKQRGVWWQALLSGGFWISTVRASRPATQYSRDYLYHRRRRSYCWGTAGVMGGGLERKLIIIPDATVIRVVSKYCLAV